MQAIKITNYGPTNHKGARIKASCDRGSLTIGYDYALDTNGNRLKVLEALLEKFALEDLEQYGTPIGDNPWTSAMWRIGEIKGYAVAVASWR